MKRVVTVAMLSLLLPGCERKPEPQRAPPPPAAPKARQPETRLDLPDPLATSTQHSADEGGLDETTNVYRLLRRNLSMVNACYKRHRLRDPQLAGKLTVKMRVGPGPKGLVEQANVVSRTFNSPPMERCVVGSLRAFSFPRKSDEALDMTVPLLFR